MKKGSTPACTPGQALRQAMQTYNVRRLPVGSLARTSVCGVNVEGLPRVTFGSAMYGLSVYSLVSPLKENETLQRTSITARELSR